MRLGFFGAADAVGFLFLRDARSAVGFPSVAINGQRQPAARGPDSAQAGTGRGPFQRPGRWLLGLGPR
jgi:hypothetical protein